MYVCHSLCPAMCVSQSFCVSISVLLSVLLSLVVFLSFPPPHWLPPHTTLPYRLQLRHWQPRGGECRLPQEPAGLWGPGLAVLGPGAGAAGKAPRPQVLGSSAVSTPLAPELSGPLLRLGKLPSLVPPPLLHPAWTSGHPGLQVRALVKFMYHHCCPFLRPGVLCS